MAHTIVRMRNPETGGVGECTVEGFRTIYQFRGWELVTSEAQYASDALDRPVGSLEDLSQAELHQVAVAAGFDGPKNAAKAKLVAAIKAGAPGGDAPAVVAVVGDDDTVDPQTGALETPEQKAARELAESDNPPSS